MDISYNWLSKIVDIEGMSLDKISDILVSRGIEVESIKKSEPVHENVVIGQILEMKQHENADKLSVLKLTDGTETFQVICGAKNMKEGDKVALAKISAKLPDGLKIKKAKLRGVLSEGMCCSLDELGVGTSPEGIYIAPESEELGKPLNKIFKGDIVLDLAISPNRGDELSHLGIARELAYALKKPITHKVFETKKIKTNKSDMNIKVSTEKGLMYFGMEFKDVKLKESPNWLKDYLIAIGLKPINNLVDISNFVLHDIGQPLHIFDLDKIDSKTIVVEESDKDFKYIALDDKEYNIKKGDILIANSKKALAIAGVIGGGNSEVSDSTKNVFLECALFDSIAIRKTARRLGISTDSSYRFERGISHTEVERAFWYAVNLVIKLASPKEVKLVKPYLSNFTKKESIEINLKELNSFIGIDLTETEFKYLLEQHAYKVEKTENKFFVQAPEYRLDVKLAADVYEDIAKYYGFKNIKAHLPVFFEENNAKQSELFLFKQDLRDILSDFGLNQVVSYSFVSEENNKKFSAINPIKLQNPIAEDFSEMRQSLLASMMPIVTKNINNGNTSLSLFEIANVFGQNARLEGAPKPNETSFVEKEQLCIILNGLTNQTPIWNEKANSYDYFYLKGLVERLANKLNITLNFKNYAGHLNFINTYKSAEVFLENVSVGVIGEFLPEITKFYKLDTTASFLEISIEKLFLASKNNKLKYRKFSQYPSVRRDISMLVDDDFNNNDVLNIIKNSGAKYLVDFNVYDLYKGDNIPKGKKAMGYYLIFSSMDKTLKDEEVDKNFKKVVNNLQKNDKISMK